jgi:hypothetical protein
VTGKEGYEVWARRGSTWSDWVSPVPFTAENFAAKPVGGQANTAYEKLGTATERGTAVVIDLPGPESVRNAMEFARAGFQPVPILNASPAPVARVTGETRSAMVDTAPVDRELALASEELAALPMAPDAPPAFFIDGNRMSARPQDKSRPFDNRWICYPQDFPSGAKLRERGISRVVVIQPSSVIAEDLRDVLAEWQRDGITIFTRLRHDRAREVKVDVREPPKFRLIWRKILRAFGFKTNADFFDFLNSLSAGTSG